MSYPPLVIALDRPGSDPRQVLHDTRMRLRAVLDAVAGGHDRVSSGGVFPWRFATWGSRHTLRTGSTRGVAVELAVSRTRLTLRVVPSPSGPRTWTVAIGLFLSFVVASVVSPLLGGIEQSVAVSSRTAGGLVGVVSLPFVLRFARWLVMPVYQDVWRSAWVESEALTQRVRQALLLAVTENNPLLSDDAVEAVLRAERPGS